MPSDHYETNHDPYEGDSICAADEQPWPCRAAYDEAIAASERMAGWLADAQALADELAAALKVALEDGVGAAWEDGRLALQHHREARK